jgi:hypothetical protein
LKGRKWEEKKILHIYMMAYYSSVKWNEIPSFAGKWMESEDIMLCNNNKG